MNVVINTPNFAEHGGVARYFEGLKDWFSCKVYFNFIGGKSKNRFLFPIRQFIDYIKFLFLILNRKPDVIHLNPSLDPKSILRDSVFILISKMFKKPKLLVYFHGWHMKYSLEIQRKYKKVFKMIYNSADAFCVLGNQFRSELKAWGITKPIYLESTKVDDTLIENYKFDQRKVNEFVILFLARITIEKGIYETIKAYELLKRKYIHISLLVAGDGRELNNVKKYTKNHKIKDIEFLGYVTDGVKRSTFERATCYILPSYSEGMPITVLEAMAFGLPIITRPVGGLKDFFEENKMGFLVSSKNPHDFAVCVERLITNESLRQNISNYNYHYSRNNFLASKVASRLEKIYKDLTS